MSAVLRWTTTPGLPDGRRLVIECRHATTTVDVFGPPKLTEAQVIQVAVARHGADCDCAADLPELAQVEGARA